MDMGVGHRLAGGLAVVDADIESGGLEFRLKLLPNLGDQPPQGRLFLGRQIEQADNVLPGHDERMPFGSSDRHRGSQAGGILQPDLVVAYLAEWASCWHR